ncbi:UNVERIFIED_CONTAM: hypothetical protein Slati_4025100 [Sesamum latifolium]|uniref:Uncharacterized protein n=1 Tax=Sesamum latifolium TaxID=2727402 RepID=A0AAW2TRB1_9LAMI
MVPRQHMCQQPLWNTSALGGLPLAARTPCGRGTPPGGQNSLWTKDIPLLRPYKEVQDIPLLRPYKKYRSPPSG